MKPTRGSIALALRCIIAITLANAPFWLLGQAFFTSRAFLNVDTIIAICVLPLSPLAGALLLCIAWIADLILSQSMTFHFRTPLEFLRSFGFVSTLDLRGYTTWGHIALTLPFICCGVALLRLTRGCTGLLRPAAVLYAALVLVDALNGSSMLSDRGTWRVPFNLAGSPVATLTAEQLHEVESSPLQSLPLQDTAQGLVDIPRWAATHPSRSVLFVIVESFGVPRAEQVRKWLDGQLIDDHLRHRYDVQRTDLPFRGPTTLGELRSLCGLAGSYRDLEAGLAAHCLPARMSRLGWTTIGMHGFSHRMFDRQTWWPLMGLQFIHFIDSPLFSNTARCGAAFRGGCDDQLIEEAIKALRPGNRFVYLLTLNTHLPLEPATLPPELATTCEQSKQDKDACELVGALGSVLRNLRTALNAESSLPLVVIVGDHAPPFARIASRSAFSADKVSAFALVPRE